MLTQNTGTGRDRVCVCVCVCVRARQGGVDDVKHMSPLDSEASAEAGWSDGRRGGGVKDWGSSIQTYNEKAIMTETSIKNNTQYHLSHISIPL